MKNKFKSLSTTKSNQLIVIIRLMKCFAEINEIIKIKTFTRLPRHQAEILMSAVIIV